MLSSHDHHHPLLLIGDDPIQIPIVERAFLAAIVVRTRGVVVDDIDAVIDALEQFCHGTDLAGPLPHLSCNQGATEARLRPDAGNMFMRKRKTGRAP